MLGVVYQPPHYDIVLPVGISFYTFATMSYTLDVYLRRALPARHFLDYALFVTFFPHLVAGPIMRPTELVPQFEHERRATRHQVRFGLALMTLGLFQKVVLADGFLGPSWNAYTTTTAIPGALDAWVATLAFGGQIFCDFAGYSTTAIGAAMCLGFAMPDNFRFPYAASASRTSGGAGTSRCPRGCATTFTSRSVAIVTARPHLFRAHGHHAAGRAVARCELDIRRVGRTSRALSCRRAPLRTRFAGYQPGPAALLGLGVLTYLLIQFTWVFFRAKTFTKAGLVLRGMFGHERNHRAHRARNRTADRGRDHRRSGARTRLMRTHTLESVLARAPAVLLVGVWAALAFAIIIEQGAGNAFIYFQF